MFAGSRIHAFPLPRGWLRRSRAVTLAIAGVVLIGVFGFATLASINYLLFHSLVELFSITVGLMIGVVAWYTFDFSRNHFLAFLGAAYPFVALIDLFHTLAYTGMGVFPADTNLPTQLWIAARSLEAAALVIAPRYLQRPLPIGRAFLTFGLVTAATLGVIAAGLFPRMHISGEGLTTTKVMAEYVIIAVLAATGIRLWRRRALLDPDILSLVACALALTAMAELLFTFYIGVYDLSNLLGHVAKLASFTLVFIGLIRTSLQEPFRILTRNSTTYDAIPDEIVVVDAAGAIRQVNRVVEERRGEFIRPGEHNHDHFHPRHLERQTCAACRAIAAGVQTRLELYYPDERRWRQITLAPIQDPYGARGMVQVLSDVTDLKDVQELLQRTNRALLAISASNHTLIHATEERGLLQDVCRIVVEKGGYRLAWVGFPDEGPERRIVPRAWAGSEEGFLTDPGFSWGDNLLGRGPEGTAIRGGEAVFLNAIDADPTFEPWREAAVARDYAAVIAFPLVAREQTLGVLGIYAAEADTFQKAEIELLEELAGDSRVRHQRPSHRRGARGGGTTGASLVPRPLRDPQTDRRRGRRTGGDARSLYRRASTSGRRPGRGYRPGTETGRGAPGGIVRGRADPTMWANCTFRPKS